MSQHSNGPMSGSLQDTDLPETGTTSSGSGSVGGYTTTDSTSMTGTTGQGTAGSTGTTATSGTESRTEAAKVATRETAGTAKGEAEHLAHTAKEELGNVSSTATEQMKRLMDQSRSELTDQARSQQQRLSSNLRTLTDELESMTSNGQQGVAHDLVRQVSQQARSLGDWLDGNEPGAVLDEVKRFARRKPGTFLAVAAGLGFLSGRMTRGLAAASQEESSSTDGMRGFGSSESAGYTAYGSPAYPGPTDAMGTTGTTEPTSSQTSTQAPTHTSDGTVGDDWMGRGDAR